MGGAESPIGSWVGEENMMIVFVVYLGVGFVVTVTLITTGLNGEEIFAVTVFWPFVLMVVLTIGPFWMVDRLCKKLTPPRLPVTYLRPWKQ